MGGTMRRFGTVAVLATALALSASPALAFSGQPPAGMTSTCTATRVDASTVHQQGVLSYADGSTAAGFTVNVLWRQQPSKLDWAVPGGVVSGAGGAWSVTYSLARSATSEVYIFWQQGSKTRLTMVNGSCPIP